MTAPPLTTGIVDLHHHDGLPDFDAFKRGGGVALIHKATEGKDWRDPAFARAMDACKAAGVARGAYHFGSASAPGATQADFFLSVVAAYPDALLVLDLENNPNEKAGTMATSEAAAFVRRVREVTGRWPVLYVGASDLRGRVSRAPLDVRQMLANCPLWLAQHGEPPTAKGVPSLWPGAGWSLWQYTSSLDNGPRDQRTYPRGVPGFARASQDRNCFRGTADELRVWWKTAGLP